MSNGSGQQPVAAAEGGPVARGSTARNTVASRLLLLALLALAAGVAAWRLGASRRETASLPAIDLNDASPEVAAVIDTAREEVVHFPRSAEAWGRLGMVLQAHEYATEALPCYERASDLAPDEFRWLYLLANLREATDKLAAAALYQRALDREPQRVQARVRLAGLWMELGRLDEAEGQLRQTLESTPQHGLARFLQARLLFQHGRYQDSLELLSALNQEPPPRRAVSELLAQVHLRLGARDKAEAENRRLRTLPATEDYWPDPYLEELAPLRRDSRWLAYQARLLFEQGQVQATLEMLEGLVSAHPEDRTLREQLARTYVVLKRLDRAAEVLDEGIRLIPDSFEMQRLRGGVHMLQNQWDAAQQRYEQALAIKPDDAAAHQDLGMCLLRRGAADKALAEFREAVRFQPDMLEPRLEIARLLLDRKQTAEAVAELKTVLGLSPNNPTAQSLLQAATQP